MPPTGDHRLYAQKLSEALPVFSELWLRVEVQALRFRVLCSRGFQELPYNLRLLYSILQPLQRWGYKTFLLVVVVDGYAVVAAMFWGCLLSPKA